VKKIKKMANLMANTSRVTALSALSAVTLLATPSLHAAKFGVTLVDATGQPVSGAAVCIGLAGSYSQFGSAHTDENGFAILDVPTAPTVVTISKNNFNSIRVTEPARNFNLIKKIQLTPGSQNVRCEVDDFEASASSVKIGNVLVSESAFSTVLRPNVSGEPTEYRVSRIPSFTASSWQRFESTIALSTRLSEEDEVFLQMRRFKGSGSSWIEARSEVVSVQLPAFR